MDALEFLMLMQYGLFGSDKLRLAGDILKSGEGASGLAKMPAGEFRRRFGQSRQSILARGLERADPAKERRLADKRGIRIVSLGDEEYPESLAVISDPPLIFYVEGAMDPPEELRLAIVGTRRPTFYGVETARRLARELSTGGFVIVSGLARGIDTSAHEGALEGGGESYGVLGTGLLNPYPPENGKLMRRLIERGGALISELPLTAPPLAFHFPLRNRILSGLCRGVCVVEASASSGSLITARLALEENREVYSIPGMIHSLTSQGTLALIQQGAKLVRSASDIAEDFRLVLASKLRSSREGEGEGEGEKLKPAPQAAET